ncbi:DUF6252 family protein [Flavobacterium sp.]|uniref:DUF6252 family protein n=1 Tax=Flavobacterium sp. TaxID=239 RepID=UPI0025D7DF4F|nr:DUF6252 family protein [Flavobacterium sp.]
MKNIKFLTGIFFILAAFTFTSCDNEPIDPALDLDNFGGGGNNGGPIVFKADFSGSTWNASAAQANISNGLITIIGTRGTSGEAFAFQILGTTTGTYPANENILAYTPANSEYGYWSLDINNGSTDTGSITITEINTQNNTISGTFNFTGYWSDTTVTNILPTVFNNGVFENIPFTTDGPAPSGDTFYAKVDGVEFVEDQIDGALITQVTGMPNQISVVGSKDNGDTVGLNIVSSLSVGTYQITGPFGEQVNGSSVINDVLYTAQSGSVTITTKTATRISGTFSMVVQNFTTSETKTISQGSFDVEYN